MPTDTAFSVSCFWKMKKRMMGGIIEKTTERIIVSPDLSCFLAPLNLPNRPFTEKKTTCNTEKKSFYFFLAKKRVADSGR